MKIKLILRNVGAMAVAIGSCIGLSNCSSIDPMKIVSGLPKISSPTTSPLKTQAYRKKPNISASSSRVRYLAKNIQIKLKDPRQLKKVVYAGLAVAVLSKASDSVATSVAAKRMKYSSRAEFLDKEISYSKLALSNNTKLKNFFNSELNSIRSQISRANVKNSKGQYSAEKNSLVIARLSEFIKALDSEIVYVKRSILYTENVIADANRVQGIERGKLKVLVRQLSYKKSKHRTRFNEMLGIKSRAERMLDNLIKRSGSKSYDNSIGASGKWNPFGVNLKGIRDAVPF